MGVKSWNDFYVAGRVYYSSESNYAITTTKMRETIQNTSGYAVKFFAYRVAYGSSTNYSINEVESTAVDGVPEIPAGTTGYYTRLQSTVTRSKAVTFEAGAAKDLYHWVTLIATFYSGTTGVTLY